MEWSVPLLNRPQVGHDELCEHHHNGAEQTMSNHNAKDTVSILGIDLSKNNFQLHGVDNRGRCVLRKTLSRAKLLPFIASLPPCVIAISAHGLFRSIVMSCANIITMERNRP